MRGAVRYFSGKFLLLLLSPLPFMKYTVFRRYYREKRTYFSENPLIFGGFYDIIMTILLYNI